MFILVKWPSSLGDGLCYLIFSLISYFACNFNINKHPLKFYKNLSNLKYAKWINMQSQQWIWSWRHTSSKNNMNIISSHHRRLIFIFSKKGKKFTLIGIGLSLIPPEAPIWNTALGILLFVKIRLNFPLSSTSLLWIQSTMRLTDVVTILKLPKWRRMECHSPSIKWRPRNSFLWIWSPIVYCKITEKTSKDKTNW